MTSLTAPPRKHTTYTLTRSTKPISWTTTYTDIPVVEDPFDFGQFVRGDRVLDISCLHDACHSKKSDVPSQWTDEDATGVEVLPPPEFPIVDEGTDGNETEVNAEQDAPSLPAIQPLISQHPNDNISSTENNNEEDGDTDSTISYCDDWDEDESQPLPPLPEDPIPVRTFPLPQPNTRESHRLTTLHHFIHAQLQLPPSSRINKIIFEDPLPYDFLAVNGLSFKHLEIHAGVTEDVDLTPVAQLSSSASAWAGIQSIVLNGVCSMLVCDSEYMLGSVKEQWTAIPSTIQTLQLNLSTSSFDFRHPNGGYHNLRNLKLLDNNAVDLFCKAWRQLPNFISQITVLHLISTNGCDFFLYEHIDFKRRLKTCTAIKTLVLGLTTRESPHARGKNIDTQLAAFIPPSIQNLSFHFSRSDAMLDDLDSWVEMASDRDWLPGLRCIRLRADAERLGYHYRGDGSLTYVEDPRFDGKIQMIYKALSQRNPPVQIVV